MGDRDPCDEHGCELSYSRSECTAAGTACLPSGSEAAGVTLTLSLVYPHPKGAKSSYSPGALHPTGGLPGNWALDFMAPGGTQVLAVQGGVVTRLSGHPPEDGVYPGAVFGWTIYVRCADGFYFSTHYGARYVHVGQHVVAGQVIARVGHWPHDEGRSHTHYGFTHDNGKAASKARILAVGKAARVKAILT